MRWLLALAVVPALAAPAAARDLPAQTPDPVARLDRDAAQVITNGSRTFLWGDFAYVGAEAASGAIVSARSGAIQALVADGRERPVPAADGGWYASRSGAVVRLRPDGSVDPGFAVALPAGDDAALALSGSTLWLAGRFHLVNGESRPGVAAVDAATGRLLPWRHDAGDATELVVTADTVYVAADAGVLALDAATGAVRAQGGVALPGTLALAGDTLYVGDSWGRVHALDATTLSTRWSAPRGVGAKDLAVAGGGLYVAGTGGVARFDAATGELSAWSTPLTSAWSLALSPDGTTGYVTRATAPGWQVPGAMAFATSDGALLGWAPGPEGAHTNGGIAVSHDGASVFLGAVPTLNTRLRRQGVVLDETGQPTPSIPPTRGNLVLDARNTVYTPLGAFWPDGSSRWPLTFTGAGGAPALSADEQTVYFPGSFTAVNGEPRTHLVAVQAADGWVLPWAPQVTGGHTTSIVAAPDGRTLYVIGTFTAINGVPRPGLAALDAASGEVLPFKPALEGAPERIRLARDGSVLYVRVGARLRGYRTSDGAAVFAPNLDAGDFVPLADGQTVIVASRNNGTHPLTAWDVATSARVPWMEADCVDCDAVSLALDPDGQTLHAAGRFGRHHYLRLAVARQARPPENEWVPHIAGSAQAGRFVECDPGRWSGHPARYRFTWTIDGVPVPGFEGRELLLEAADAGHWVTCEVRAEGGAQHAKSDPLLVAGPSAAFARRLAVPAIQRTLEPGPPAVALPPPDPGPRPDFSAPLARAALADRMAPDLQLRRAGRSVRIFVSERSRVTLSLRRGKRTYKRAFTLAGGRHTFTAKRLKVPRGRYSLTVKATDGAGNSARRVLRLSV
jgi:hypothetical protein